MTKPEVEVHPTPADTLDSARDVPYTPPPLSPVELARWAWRQLTSMRVALLLLFLLALLAIPGSLLPQRRSNPVAVAGWIESNPGLGELYDTIGLFDVYSTPWFASVYMLLFISLVGCIVPRSLQHLRAIRARPPRAPRNLSRLPAHNSYEVDAAPDEVLARARDVLRTHRYRVATHDGSVAGEKGHLRETGNLVFHLSLVIVLVGVAISGLFGYRAQVLVTQGSGFANSIIQFDSMSTGARFDVSDLSPFSLRVEEFEMDFRDSGDQIGSPESFAAHVQVTPAPGEDPYDATIRVNHPLRVNGTTVHILNPGYAPQITVRDAAGEVLFSGAVPFLPQDDNYLSTGVVKVQVPSGNDIGIQGIFLPTAPSTLAAPQSLFPEPLRPVLYFTAWHGDLGLDDGQPESVYRLDTAGMEQFEVDGEPFRQAIGIGQSAELPDGAGTVTLDGYVPWVNFQVSTTPGKTAALVGVIAAVLGLIASLFVRRRRVWVRVSATDQGRTVVEVAGLDRSEGGDLSEEIDRLTRHLDELERTPKETP